jgi:hypothetical protein
VAIVNGGILCCECQEWRPLENFAPVVRKAGCGQCNRCKAKQRSAAYRRDPAPWRRREFQKYGLTEESFADMVVAQGGRCACCGATIESKSKRCKRLFVDHDHVTGKVRGLLCYHCNTGIGHLGDNAESVRRALTYLERSVRTDPIPDSAPESQPQAFVSTPR